VKEISFLDVTQTHIKINQTTQTDGGKPKLTTQINAPTNSFNQVLAKFNFLGHSHELDGQSAAPPAIENESDMTGSIQTDPVNISEEDWMELDSILVALLAGIQQEKKDQIAPQQSLEKFFSVSEPQLVSTMLSPLQEGTPDSNKALALWLQKVEGLNQPSSLALSQLLERLAKIIGNIKSLERQNSMEVPNNIGDKIQMILDASKINKFAIRTPFNSQSHENALLFDDKKQTLTRGLTPLDEQSAVSSIQNITEKPSSIQTEPMYLSAEDWQKLNSILKALIAGIQQGQQSQTTTMQQPLENRYLASDSQPSVVSTILNPLQEDTTDAGKAISLWLHKVEGLNQTSTLEPSQWMQRLGQFIGELQSLENQNTMEVPNEIREKIQLLVDLSKTENKFASLESKLKLILDKNQLIFSSDPLPGTSIDEETRFSHVPFTKQGEDQAILNGIPLMVTQQQGTDGSNVSKAVSPPPILSVSEFVPEVSEWIGRYIRITNGQPGGTEAKLSLYPEHLGHIEIKITSMQGQLSAQIVTDTLMAKEALEGQLQQLRQALQEHGLQIKKLDIVQQTPEFIDSSQANLSYSQGGSNSSLEQRTFTSAQDASKNQADADETEKENETLSVTYGRAVPKTASSIDFTA
jgi:flagellar hook-length control protein FliK